MKDTTKNNATMEADEMKETSPKEAEAENPSSAEEVTASKGSQKAEKKESAEEKLKAELAALEKTVAEKDDKYLRLAAEYDNYRRRTLQERSNIYTDALADAVKDILPILDDLERAALYKEAEKVAEGLTIVTKSAVAAMQKLGVVAFGEVGEAFDASLHNAVMHEEDDAFAQNVIKEVFQKGYRKGDKIIRYAMVKVVN